MNVNSNAADRLKSESSWIKPIDDKGIQWTLGKDGSYTGTQKVKVTPSNDQEYTYTITLSNILNQTQGENLFKSKIAEIMKVAIDCGITPKSKKSLEYSNDTYTKINAKGEKREIKPAETLQRRKDKIDKNKKEIAELDLKSQSVEIEKLRKKLIEKNISIKKKIETERFLSSLLSKNENSESQQPKEIKNEIEQPTISQKEKEKLLHSTPSSKENEQSAINPKRGELQILMDGEQFTAPELGTIRYIVLKNKEISNEIAIFPSGTKEKILNFLKNKCTHLLTDKQKNEINNLLHPENQKVEDAKPNQTIRIESSETNDKEKTLTATYELTKTFDRLLNHTKNLSIDDLKTFSDQIAGTLKIKRENEMTIRNLTKELRKKNLNPFRKSKIDRRTKINELQELKKFNDELSSKLVTSTKYFDVLLNQLKANKEYEINTPSPALESFSESIKTYEELLKEFASTGETFMRSSDVLLISIQTFKVKPKEKSFLENYTKKIKEANDIFRANEKVIQELISNNIESDPEKLISKLDKLCDLLLSDDFSKYCDALNNLILSIEDSLHFPAIENLKVISPSIYMQRLPRILLLLEEINKTSNNSVSNPNKLIPKIDLAILKVKSELNKMNNKT